LDQLHPQGQDRQLHPRDQAYPQGLQAQGLDLLGSQAVPVGQHHLEVLDYQAGLLCQVGRELEMEQVLEALVAQYRLHLHRLESEQPPYERGASSHLRDDPIFQALPLQASGVHQP